MKTEIIKYLLDIGFEVSTDGYLDKDNKVCTYPVVCMYFMENDYELWINYSKNGFTLNSIDFTREIKVNNLHEIAILVNMLKI